jgi:heme/copper-type cytochrome/quinol oxidase subunit 2
MDKKGQTMSTTHIPESHTGKSPNILITLLLIVVITIVVIGLVIFFVFRITLKSNEEYMYIDTQKNVLDITSQ